MSFVVSFGFSFPFFPLKDEVSGSSKPAQAHNAQNDQESSGDGLLQGECSGRCADGGSRGGRVVGGDGVVGVGCNDGQVHSGCLELSSWASKCSSGGVDSSSQNGHFKRGVGGSGCSIRDSDIE